MFFLNLFGFLQFYESRIRGHCLHAIVAQNYICSLDMAGRKACVLFA